MKKLVCMLLAAVLLCCFVSCNKDGTPEGMKNVAVESASFYLYVPEAWIPTSTSGISGAKVFESGDTSNVTATACYPDEIFTPTTYWEQKCLPEYRKVFSDIAMIEDQCGDTTLGGRDAKRYVFTYTLGEVQYEIMQVIAVYDVMVYTLTYTAEGTKYQSHLEDVNSIVANFTFR
ncbi:MAG: DUF1795 domain-containing protein [Ruminococcaceae bacterium]|nr:DUF1795 domain-containing protein [Oscillospiraceae bacterium]